MDLLKTFMVYMMIVMTNSAEEAPGLTPPPVDVTPAPTAYVTMIPLPETTGYPQLTPVLTASPSSVPTATRKVYRTLSKGDRGDDVRALQQRLNELHYDAGTADGIFGKKTKDAVRDFQKNNGLTVDGIAGQKTLTVLFESTSPISQTKKPGKPTPPPSPTPQPSTVNVPVYYADQNGTVFYETSLTLYNTATIYAQPSLVPQGYTPLEADSVKVTIQNGKASPASVVFRYQAPETPVPTEAPTEVPTAAPAEAPTDVPTEAPTDAPTDMPTEAPTAAPTEAPTEAPTDMPTEAPTNVPTDMPTEAPTNVPTDEPTEVPTDAPTESPTEAPTEQPSALPFIQAGNKVLLNGAEKELVWYKTPDQRIMISLRDASAAAEIPCIISEEDGSLMMTLCKNALITHYNDEELLSFAYNGSPLDTSLDESLSPIVWQRNLYVSQSFLQMAGVTCTEENGTLILENFVP